MDETQKKQRLLSLRTKEAQDKGVAASKVTRARDPEWHEKRSEMFKQLIKLRSKASLVEAGRKGWVTNSNRITGKRPYMLKCGRALLVDSSWEGILYDFLSTCGVSFSYINEENTKRILVDGSMWKPDFTLETYELIIEVKGHWLAKKYFDTVKLPLILDTDALKTTAIAVADLSSIKRINHISTLSDLLLCLKWVQVPENHVLKSSIISSGIIRYEHNALQSL